MSPAEENKILDIDIVRRDRDRTAKGFRFKLLAETAAMPVTKPHIIKGIFARGETSAWIGPPGSLKSALMASAAIAVASGRDWFGRRNKERCGVVYFALERADLVERRLQAMTDEMDLPIAVVRDVIDLLNSNSVAKVAATVREVTEALGVPVGVLIFDTFAKLIAAGGGDEDKAKDQGRLFTNIQRVKDLTRQPHVALLGHTGKDESRGSRGSNAILGDVDLMVTISGAETKTATVIKANDAPEGPLFSFKSEIHDFGRDDDGDSITVNVISAEEVECAPARRASKWTKGLKLIHDAIAEASLQAGIDHRVGGDGPTVKAVPVHFARDVHAQRYVSTGEGDRNEAERKAWRRNFKAAQDGNLIGGELREGQELIWLAR